MAKLYINKDIAADADKMKYWLTGNDSISFPDIQGFMDWIPGDDNRIDIELHSCGGDCTEAYAIYDALRASGKEISCKVVGNAASMATVILLAAPLERRSAYQHAQLLIHSPYYPAGAKVGDITLTKLEELKTDLQAEKEKMLALYVERTGVDRTVLEAQMDTDSWFNAEKAIELGFISSIVPAASASANKTEFNNPNIKSMAKEEKKVTVAQAFHMLGVALGVVKETPEAVGMVITTSTGEELTVEREEGEIQVGDPASPDGEFVLEDGRTVVVVDGVITEIKDPSSSEEDTQALKDRIAELEAENASLKSSAKSETDARIIAAVEKAGGEAWLKKATGAYVPAGRSYSPQTKKTEEAKPISLVEQKLEEAREKNKKRYSKK
jgi:ATP-dependent Clp protease protease subunit|uniref:Putative ATP dependent Clp protease n=1 Tax=Siphoviridae sp. cttma3 TaxID=2825708 RepID=A0A8S5V8V7_9CAUD|nr:MAG TPA: putative ATP dependent Clp protease [Siphoviridae sp. cttma3]